MKNRAISENFMNALLSGEFKHIIEIVKVDPSLDMEMRGDSVMVYYRGGGRILTINDLSIVPNRSKLEGMDENYSNETKLGKRFLRQTLMELMNTLQRRKGLLTIMNSMWSTN